jgi:H+/Cl- antiporter ClcA
MEMIALFVGALLGMGFSLMVCWWQAMRENDDITAIVAGMIGMAAITTAVVVTLSVLEVI